MAMRISLSSTEPRNSSKSRYVTYLYCQGQTKHTSYIWYKRVCRSHPQRSRVTLLAHPFVSECAVIQVPNERSGEVPKALIVRSKESTGKPEQETTKTICEYVEKHKAHYRWLTGGVELLKTIPKTATAKIIRRVLRKREKKARKANQARL